MGDARLATHQRSWVPIASARVFIASFIASNPFLVLSPIIRMTRISTTFDDFDDLAVRLTQFEDTGDEAPTNKLVDSLNLRRDGDSFTFEANLAQLDDAFANASGGGASFGIDPTQFLQDLFLIRFVETMPGTVGEHNAHTLDGSTLTWEIPLDGADRTLRATSTTGSGAGIALIVAVLLGIPIIGVVVLTIVRRRNAVTNTYSAPTIYGDTSDEPSPVGADPFSS